MELRYYSPLQGCTRNASGHRNNKKTQVSESGVISRTDKHCTGANLHVFNIVDNGSPGQERVAKKNDIFNVAIACA